MTPDSENGTPGAGGLVYHICIGLGADGEVSPEGARHPTARMGYQEGTVRKRGSMTYRARIGVADIGAETPVYIFNRMPD